MPRSYRTMNKHWPTGWNWKPWPLLRVVSGMYQSARTAERVYGYRYALLRRAGIAGGYFARRPKIAPGSRRARQTFIVPMMVGSLVKKRRRRCGQ